MPASASVFWCSVLAAVVTLVTDAATTPNCVAILVFRTGCAACFKCYGLYPASDGVPLLGCVRCTIGYGSGSLPAPPPPLYGCAGVYRLLLVAAVVIAAAAAAPACEAVPHIPCAPTSALCIYICQ